MAELTWKGFGLNVLLGAGVVALTPMLSGLLGGLLGSFSFLVTPIVGGLSIVGAASAGAVALGLGMLIDMYLK